MRKIVIVLALGVGIALGMYAPTEAEAMPPEENCCVTCGSTTACGWCGASCGSDGCLTTNKGCRWN